MKSLRFAVDCSSTSKKRMCLIPFSLKIFRAITAEASGPSLVIRRTSALSRAAATAWFEPFPPGPILNASPRMVSPHFGIRLVRQVRSATNAPNTQTFGFGIPSLIRVNSRLFWQDDSLFDDYASVRAQLAGCYDGEGLFIAFIERMTLDLYQRYVPVLLVIDHFFELFLYFWYFISLFDDLPPHSHIFHK